MQVRYNIGIGINFIEKMICLLNWLTQHLCTLYNLCRLLQTRVTCVALLLYSSTPTTSAPDAPTKSDGGGDDGTSSSHSGSQSPGSGSSSTVVALLVTLGILMVAAILLGFVFYKKDRRCVHQNMHNRMKPAFFAGEHFGHLPLWAPSLCDKFYFVFVFCRDRVMNFFRSKSSEPVKYEKVSVHVVT